MFVKQDLFFSPPKPFLSHFFFKNNNIPSKISSFSWNNTSKVSAFSSLSSNKSNLSHNVAFPVSSKPFTMFLPKTSTFAIGISRKERYVQRKVDEITDKVVATLKKPVEERLKIFEDVVIKLLKEKKIYDGSKINLGTILSMGANDAVKVILVKGCVIKPSEKLESEDQVFVEKKTEEEKKNKTLWIGELQQWMEEKYILISFHGKVTSTNSLFLFLSLQIRQLF